jgi:hypothetical protein
MEKQLLLELTGNGHGQIALKGQARDDAGIGNLLRFHLELDRTQLSPLIAQLEAILVAYPVAGSPAA